MLLNRGTMFFLKEVWQITKEATYVDLPFLTYIATDVTGCQKKEAGVKEIVFFYFSAYYTYMYMCVYIYMYIFIPIAK